MDSTERTLKESSHEAARTKKRRLFINLLLDGSSIFDAAKASKVGRRTVYTWYKSDEKFRAEWDEAVAMGNLVIEQEAYSRATIGKSDVLLIFLMKNRMREKYGDKGRDGDINIGNINIASLNETQLTHLVRRLASHLSTRGSTSPSIEAAQGSYKQVS